MKRINRGRVNSGSNCDSFKVAQKMALAPAYLFATDLSSGQQITNLAFGIVTNLAVHIRYSTSVMSKVAYTCVRYIVVSISYSSKHLAIKRVIKTFVEAMQCVVLRRSWEEFPPRRPHKNNFGVISESCFLLCAAVLNVY